jgi:lipopolysaccharide transport system permease protein
VPLGIRASTSYGPSRVNTGSRDVADPPSPREGPHSPAEDWDATRKGGKPSIIIRPRRGWIVFNASEMWKFRELLLRFAARDITLRYRQTALGVTWVVLQPLLGAGILSFVFGNVARLPPPAGIPYFTFSLAGMVVWTGFSQTVIRSSAVLVANANMVQKVFFPRVLLPLSAALSTMVDIAVSLLLVAIVMPISGVYPGVSLVALPLWLAAALAAGLGVGLVAGALMVRYRDIQFIAPVGVQLLLFLSPIAYALSRVPAASRLLYEVNPLAGLLEGFRWSLLATSAPSLGLATYAVAMSFGTLLTGFLVFHRLDRGFADVI